MQRFFGCVERPVFIDCKECKVNGMKILSSTIFEKQLYAPTQKTCLFTYGNKANVSARSYAFECKHWKRQATTLMWQKVQLSTFDAISLLPCKIRVFLSLRSVWQKRISRPKHDDTAVARQAEPRRLGACDCHCKLTVTGKKVAYIRAAVGTVILCQ